MDTETDNEYMRRWSKIKTARWWAASGIAVMTIVAYSQLAPVLAGGNGTETLVRLLIGLSLGLGVLLFSVLVFLQSRPYITKDLLFANRIPAAALVGRRDVGEIIPSEIQRAWLERLGDQTVLTVRSSRGRSATFFFDDEGPDLARVIKWLGNRGIEAQGVRA